MFDGIKNLVKKKPKIVSYELDQESVKENNIIKNQANQLAESQGELARYKTDEEFDTDEDEEERIKLHLNQEKKELNKKDKNSFFSLKTFFYRYFNDKNFRKKLCYTTFDRGHNISKFGDVGFLGNYFAVVGDNGNLLTYGRELKDLFQSIPGLGNDVDSFKIPLNLDSEMIPIENIMVWEIPSIIREGDGFKYSKARRKPIYKLLQEKEAIIQESNKELEEAEETLDKLQDESDSAKRENSLNKKRIDIQNKQMSKLRKEMGNREKEFVNMEVQITKLQQIYTTIQQDNIRLNKELEKMRKIAEREDTKLNFDKALTLIRNIRNDLANVNAPEQITKVSSNEPQG